MVLVDSSVWIKYFNSEEDSKLSLLIAQNLVLTNDIILSELIPFLNHHKSFEAVDSLYALKKLKLDIDWGGIRKLQEINLKNGINKVGIPDLIIIQQSIQNKIIVWSNDKHFHLISKYVNIDLF